MELRLIKDENSAGGLCGVCAIPQAMAVQTFGEDGLECRAPTVTEMRVTLYGLDVISVDGGVNSIEVK